MGVDDIMGWFGAQMRCWPWGERGVWWVKRVLGAKSGVWWRKAVFEVNNGYNGVFGV